jgi:Tol biopolymer transport system component
MSGVVWTPDGTRLLFSRSEKDPPELCAIPAAGGPVRSLGLAANDRARIAIHPDGRRIAFTAGRTELEIWEMSNILPQLRATSLRRHDRD